MDTLHATPANPYIYKAPVEGDLFFGREIELEQILSAVTKPAKQNIFVSGMLHAGKTSLLYQLKKMLLDTSFFPIYISLQDSNSTEKDVLEIILQSMRKQLIESGMLKQNFPLNADFSPTLFRSDIGKIILAVQEYGRKEGIILLLDDADNLLSRRTSASDSPDRSSSLHTAQKILRATLQSSSLAVVMTGNTTPRSFSPSGTEDFFSELLNLFRFVLLQPLTDEETRKLIEEPAIKLQYKYDRDGIERIIKLSGGLPFYCQALCNNAFAKAFQLKNYMTISVKDVKFAEEQILKDLFEEYREEFWALTNEEERRILFMLVQHKWIKSIPKAETKRLFDWQIITESRGDYVFSSKLFELWTDKCLKKGE